MIKEVTNLAKSIPTVLALISSYVSVRVAILHNAHGKCKVYHCLWLVCLRQTLSSICIKILIPKEPPKKNGLLVSYSSISQLKVVVQLRNLAGDGL